MINEIPPYHKHNLLDGTEKIDPKDLLGFPAFTSAPTHNALDGTIVLMDDKSSIRRIYVMLNGTWRYTNLT